MWNFHVDDSQENARYDIILGRDVVPEIWIYLYISNYTIRGNGCEYKGCATPMKDIQGYVITPTEHIEDKSCRNE